MPTDREHPDALSRVSLYSNLGASGFNHLPSQAYVHGYLDDATLALLPTEFLASGRDLWLFGPVPKAPLSCPTTVFTTAPRREDPSSAATSFAVVLDSWSCVDSLCELGAGKKLTALFDIDFLGSLFDPRPCLAALKRLMTHSDIDCFFIQRKPAIHYQRRWLPHEFRDFLQCSGFEIIDSRPTAACLAFIHARLSPARHADHLEALGLRDLEHYPDLLLVTTEDAALTRTGGIGTYVANVRRLNPRSVVLFAGNETGAASEVGRTVRAKQILGDVSHEQLFEGDGLLEAVRTILYMLPTLAVCEFQDYQSIGFRLVQAKMAAGLPDRLALRAFLHGNIDYVKYGTADRDAAIYSPSEIRSIIKDRFIFRNADQVIIPSAYLRDLMVKEYGYEIPDPVVQPLPFDLEPLSANPVRLGFEKPRIIVYIGKFSVLKGWGDFIEALERARDDLLLRKIEKIVVLAPGEMPTEDRNRIESVAACEHLHLAHAEVLDFLGRNRAKALFVVPSGGENYPFVFLELLLSACRVIGYRRGGALEVMNHPEYIDLFFVEPGPENLSRKIVETIDVAPDEQEPVVKDASDAAWSRQRRINEEISRASVTTPGRGTASVRYPIEDVTIATPVFNTPLSYLEELAASIRGSAVQPKEWILVNDGSSEDYTAELIRFSERLTDITCRLVHQENRGLAGARNRGLAESGSRLTYFMDSDDVLLPHTLSHALMAMAKNRGRLLAVGGFAVYFQSAATLGCDVEPYRTGRYWKPLGISDARSLAILQNEFITANCLIDTELARNTGGWDETDRSTWEDWAFFLNATWRDQAILLMPWPGYLYRNTPNSMSKTYNQFFGIRRLVRNLGHLDRFEANVLIGLVQHGRQPEVIVREDSQAARRIRMELDSVYQSRSWRLTGPLRSLHLGLKALKQKVASMTARTP